MYFKRIEMHGFKSFAEPVSIEFNEGITCIVGPNGSGKSNISDAIRWVLGEQSPKMLRGGKMEEVIFAGTASRKSRGMAEVTLVIDNTSGILPIDYSEVAITRRMYRSGESEYSINKVPCRLKDIRELIMDTGIGVDGYSIIGQGKIADIVSNKTESRREIFEEAAGIVKYRSKKAESERKLEASQGNLDRVDDIISEIESRIDGLKEDSEKASEYLVLKEKYKTIEINVILKNIENIELKNEYIKDELTELEQEIKTCKEQKAAIDQDAAENRLRSEELDRTAAKANEELLGKVEEINQLQNRMDIHKERLQSIEKDQERLHEEIKLLTEKAEKEEENREQLTVNKSEKDGKIAELESRFDENNRILQSLTEALNERLSISQANRNRIYELHSLESSKNSEAASLSSLQETLKKRKAQITGETSLGTDEEGSLDEKYKAALNSKETIEKQLYDIRRTLDETRHSEQMNTKKERELETKLSQITLAMGQAAARKKVIEEMESAYEGYNHGVKFIMRSGLHGIEGVVADLISAPKGYETAVETALGAALQNVVCQDDESAKKAISALKAGKAGRLTFLPLSSIKPSSGASKKGLEGDQGFVGIGVDCVGFSEKYRKIVDYLLGRVVIVKDLDSAVRLSKRGERGLRYVTLSGEIINAGGAITGGAYKSSTAGLLERKGEGKRLEKSIQEMENEKRELERATAGVKDQLFTYREQAGNLEREGREKEMALLNWENQIKGIASRRAEIGSAQDKRQKELDDIETEMSSAGQMIEKLREEAMAAAKEQQELEAKVETENAALEEENQEISRLNEEITKLRLDLGEARSEKNSIDQLVSRIEDYVKELNEESRVKELAIAQLSQQREEIMKESGNTPVILAEKEAQKVEIEEVLSRTTQEKTLISNYLAQVEGQKEAVDSTLLGLQNSKHEMELKLAKNETQVESYKEKIWNDFEVSYIQAIDFKKREFVLSSAVKESREIRGRMKALGDVNIGAIKEYEQVKERYDFLTGQRQDLLSAMDVLKQIIDDMDKTIKRSFKESFDKIVENFEVIFKVMFGGGNAELHLDDPNNPLESSIEIVAQPPGKKLQNINLMSGGEKTMTAIALMCAVLKAKPTPFCILDEVEAALDEMNIQRFVKYLKDFKEIQFALVTHQKATMEYADALYGVTMPEQGISRVVSLKLGDDFDLD